MAKKKNSNKNEEFEERMPQVDRKYEDIPLAKDDPVMKTSSEIQKAHTLGFLGIIFGFTIPFIGIFLGVVGFLKTKALTEVPYDLKRRYASSKSLCKAAIAVGIFMMAALVFFLTSGVIKLPG